MLWSVLKSVEAEIRPEVLFIDSLDFLGKSKHEQVGSLVMSVQERRRSTQHRVLHTSGQEEGTRKKRAAQGMTVTTKASSSTHL